MKVLICTAFYYARGGAEVCALNLASLLESKGHEVISFSMEHPNNLHSAYSPYFTSYINYPELLQHVNPENIFKATERIIFSRETQDKLTQLIEDTKPDIAHVHNVGHELSPSVLFVLAREKIPVVSTVHDFGLLCPNSSFLSHGELCERCQGAKFYQVVLRRCKRNSVPASALACLGSYTHYLLKTYRSKVDTIIAPSAFLRNKMIEYGYPPDKIVHVPNTVDLKNFRPSASLGNYILYFGRLSYEKGIYTLFNAMTQLPDKPLIVAGEGPLDEELKEYAQKKGLKNINFVGYQSGQALHDLVRGAAFVVVPSECYENAPLACIESMALGRAVIGSDIGGIPELIQDGKTGLLFKPRDAGDLVDKINCLSAHPEWQIEMGKKGRARVELMFDSDRYYESLMNIYCQLARVS
jgi:glycosyltransferase involved in cell wall biosynthesis